MKTFFPLFLCLISLNIFAQLDHPTMTMRYNTANSGSKYSGYWTKIATCTIRSAWGDYGGTFLFYANGGGARFAYGELTVRFKNQNSTLQSPNYSELVLKNSNLTAEHFKAVINGLTVDVYVKMPLTYTTVFFKCLIQGSGLMTPIQGVDSGDFVSDLNSLGTIVNCVSQESKQPKQRNLVVEGNGTIAFPARNFEKSTILLNHGSQKLGLDGNQIAATHDLYISTNTGPLSFATNDTIRMSVDTKGRLGIGGSITHDEGDLLTVKGGIQAQKVKVTINAGADFVFADDYKLPDLNELEKFVITKKHLPQIQSEKDMQENGIELGEMNIRLLQKVEELTLYVIQQNKMLQKQAELLEKQAELQEKQQQQIDGLVKTSK